MTKRRPRKPLTLVERVEILEGYCDGLIRQSQLELDRRLRALEQQVVTTPELAAAVAEYRREFRMKKAAKR